MRIYNLRITSHTKTWYSHAFLAWPAFKHNNITAHSQSVVIRHNTKKAERRARAVLVVAVLCRMNV